MSIYLSVLVGLAHVLAASDTFTVPSNPYKELKQVSFVVDQESDYYICITMSAVSDWTGLTSTSFSGYFAAERMTRVDAIYTAPFTSSATIKPGYMVAEFSSPSAGGAVRPGQTVSVKVCGDKPKSAASSNMKIEGSFLLWIGETVPASPLKFKGGSSTVVPASNVCFADLSKIPSQFHIIAGKVGPLVGAKIGGRILSQSFVELNSLTMPVGAQDCPTCAGTNASLIQDSVILAGTTIRGWTTLNTGGLCAGVLQGSGTLSIASQVLATVPAACPIRGNFSMPYNWTEILQSMSVASSHLKTLPATGIVGYNSESGAHVVLYPYAAKYQVFNLDGTKFAQDVTKLTLYNSPVLSDSELIVLNVRGTSVTLTNFNGELLKSFKSKIIFNFFEAKTIALNYGQFHGTILAPNADITLAASHIEGNVMANSILGFDSNIFPVTFVGLSLSSKCATCAPGLFGSSCQVCSASCAFNEFCDDGASGTGACQCKPEWNAQCTDCAANRFGANCTGICTASCVANGVCSTGINGNGSCSCRDPFGGAQCDGCKAGFAGFPACNVCATGRFGSNCESSCAASCVNGGTCDSGFTGTGQCLGCRPEFVGSLCEACAPLRFGSQCQGVCSNTCITNGFCDSGITGNGTCTCRPNFTGTQCERCSRPGYYGSNCDRRCSETCLAHGICFDGPLGTGFCRCNHGRKGDECEESGSSAATPSLFLLLLLVCIALLFV